MADQLSSDMFVLKPPDSVAGMQVLSKDAFTKKVKIPGIKVETKTIQKNIKLWKKQQLDLKGMASIAPLPPGDPQCASHRLLLLDPAKLAEEPFSQEVKGQLGIEGVATLNLHEVELTYDNWSLKDILHVVLPKDSENVSSFSLIGHIAHLNLREHSLPYSSLIGQVILDKVPQVKTVVNKLGMIDNTYRNFKIDLLAGEDNYVTQLRESGCLFELDFSKVYWNSRLATEHSRIITATKSNSVVYDVFAGIGPFALPLAKTRSCKVFANDLNPSSYEYLKKNVTLNKKLSGSVECFNLDGREFIRTIIKKDLTDKILHILDDSKSDSSIPTTTVVMNLPALAVDFLDAFTSLLKDLPLSAISHKQKWAEVLPRVHCYSFVKINEHLGDDITDEGNSRLNDHSQHSTTSTTTTTAESANSKSKEETHSSEKLKLKNNRTHVTDCMENQLRRRAMSAMTVSLPADISVRWVRKVSNNKDMVCLSFQAWPELLLGGGGEEGDGEPQVKRQKTSEL